MKLADHKTVRRAILELLYHAYLDDPLRMVEPEAFYACAPIKPENIVPNMHYLNDRKLVEMMMGYTPPMFSAVRITAAGIDLVEDRYNFNLQFPAGAPDGGEAECAIPHLVEHLVAQGDLSPLEGRIRRQLLNDIQFLREELAQPQDCWRDNVIAALLDWIGERHEMSGGALPALPLLRDAVRATRGATRH